MMVRRLTVEPSFSMFKGLVRGLRGFFTKNVELFSQQFYGLKELHIQKNEDEDQRRRFKISARVGLGRTEGQSN